LRKLGDEQQKLLAAHYAEAIPLDLLKTEQERITTEIATAEGRPAAAATDFQTAKTNLERALTRIGDCQLAYREASPAMRRQFNLAFFRQLLVDDEDGSVTGDLAEPFATLLGDELKNAVIASADQEFGEAVDAKLRERELALNAPTPAPFGSGGFSQTSLVPANRPLPRTEGHFGPAPISARAVRCGGRSSTVARRALVQSRERLHREGAGDHGEPEARPLARRSYP
jgi:hypothetical protein